MFTSIFFEDPIQQAVITFALYIMGMIVAIIVAKVLKSTHFIVS